MVRYYLYCDQSLSNPFQQVRGSRHPALGCLGWGVALGRSVTAPPLQVLTVFQRSLTTMQIQIQGLIQFALPLFPTAEVRGWGEPGPYAPHLCSLSCPALP